MTASALLLALTFLLAIGFYLMGELKFLIPYRAFLFHEYGYRARGLFRGTVPQRLRGRIRPHSQVLPQRHWSETVPHRQAISRWKRESARRLRLRRENVNNVPLRL